MEELVEPWGWSSYFNEFSRFLLSCERQYGTANEQYTEYVVDRLGVCVRNVSALAERIEDAMRTDTNAEVLQTLLTSLSELGQILSSLLEVWQQYQSECEARDASNRFRAPLQQSSRRRGRPRFDISSDQLEYL